MSKAHPSIKYRVRAVILLASVVVLLATAVAFVVFEVLSFRSQLAQNLTTLAAVVADNSAVTLSFDNRSTAEQVLASLKAEPDIVVAVLYDERDEVFATYPATASATMLPAHPQKSGRMFSSGALRLFQPVMQEGKQIGTLYLCRSLRTLYARFWNYGGIVGIVLCGSLAAAFLLSTLLQRRISDPILALAKTTREIAARGDYTVRAEKLSEDEVGVFTDSFNHMLEQIQQREGALRNSERVLREQFDLLNTITDNTPSCLWMLDAEGRCTFANPASRQISGFTPGDLIGKQLHPLVHHTRPDGTPFPVEECRLEGLRRLREPIQGHEDIFVHKDGHFYPVRCNARPIIRDDKPAGTVLEVQDITDIVKAREAVAQQQQRLERMVAERTAALRDTVQQLETFSYSVAHDMRAPLRTMSNFAGFLCEEEADRLTPTGRDYLRRVMSGAERLDALINDVLTYSRVSKAEANLEVVSLDTLVSNVIREYPDLSANAENIEVRHPLPKVVGNTSLLTQCVSNLIGNALKFVPSGRTPHVVIWAEHHGATARLWVEDNGIGIPPGERKNLFGLFQRLTTSAGYPGTGVGLATVKRAVERMNGTVDVESILGEGSRFWIELPAA